MEDPGSSSPARKLFFPLRSAVELFVDPRSPDAVTKAKEAAILYDELTFEVGILDVSITPNGSTSFWNPPEAMTPELLDRSRRIDAVGSPMTLAIGRQDEPGIPAEEMHVFVEGQVSHRFLAEFHIWILDDLASFEPDWVRTIDIGAEKQPGSVGEPIYEAIRQRNFADFTDSELMPNHERFLRSFIYESFNRDATVAAELESSFTGTPLFAPMIVRGGVEAEVAGNEALVSSPETSGYSRGRPYSSSATTRAVERRASDCASSSASRSRVNPATRTSSLERWATRSVVALWRLSRSSHRISRRSWPSRCS